MTERIAYVNGEFVPESRATVSILDRGFQWGDAVYDVERTFRGKVFKLEQHMDRLYRSAYYTRIDPGLTKEEMTRITRQVVEANLPLLGENDDFTVRQVVSRGMVDPWGSPVGLQASVAVCNQVIPFALLAGTYFHGVHAITPSIRRTPPQCLSPKSKICNKMNLILGEIEAKLVRPDAFSVMLDLDGNLTESSGANFMFASRGRIMLPDRRNVLAGISMETALELADSVGIPVVEGDFTPADVYAADEAFLVATSYCIRPVATLNGLKIGGQIPGPITRRLTEAWSELVGVDIVGQALSHLRPEEREALMAARE